MELKDIAEILKSKGISQATIIDHMYDDLNHSSYATDMRKKIKALNTTTKLFISGEFDINKDSKLNLKPSHSKKFDYLTAAIHELPSIGASYSFNRFHDTIANFKPKEVMDEHMRILINFTRNNDVKVIAHLFRGPFFLTAMGFDVFRYLKKRDLVKLAKEARSKGIIFEIVHTMFKNIKKFAENDKQFSKAMKGYLRAIKILNDNHAHFCTGSDSHRLMDVGKVMWPRWIIDKIGVRHLRYPGQDL